MESLEVRKKGPELLAIEYFGMVETIDHITWS